MRVALVEGGSDRTQQAHRYSTLLAAGLERAGVEVGILRGFHASSAVNGLDLIHLLHPADPSSLLWGNGTRSVVTLHASSPAAVGARHVAGGVKARFDAWRSRRSLRNASALVCDSDRILERVGASLGPARRQLRARIYPPLRAPSRDDSTPLPAAVAALARRYLLHLGADTPDAGRELLLSAVAGAHGGPALVLAGTPPDATLLARAHALGIGERVVTLAQPPEELRDALFRNAQALVFTSLSDDFPALLLEAAACGCPVVARATPAVLEVARSFALLAAAHDAAELMRCIDRAREPAERERVRGLGRARAEQFQGIELAREYLAIYERLLTVRPRGE